MTEFSTDLLNRQSTDELPEDWSETPVQDLIEKHFCGPSPDCEERQIATDEEWGVLKTTAITWGGWNENAHKVLPRSYWGRSALTVQRGDVLVTKAGPRDRVAVVVHVDGDPKRLIVSGKMIGLRPHRSAVVPQFLAGALSLRRPQNYIHARTTGMAESQVNFANTVLLEAKVPIPKLDEQTRIAAVLDTVDEATAKTEAVIAKLRQVRAGLLHDLLTRGLDAHGQLRDPIAHPEQFQDSPLGQIPKEWNCKTLQESADWFSGGTPSRSQPSWWTGDVPILTPKDMKVFEISDTIEHVTEEAAIAGSKVMPPDTAFIVVRGMILAHTFPVCLSTRPFAFNQDIKAVRGREDLKTRFLAHWFAANASAFLRKTTEATHGTKKLDSKELHHSQIGVPEAEEQDAIVGRIEAFNSAIAGWTAELGKLNLLKSGLMNDLLTGRVRVPEGIVGAG